VRLRNGVNPVAATIESPSDRGVLSRPGSEKRTCLLRERDAVPELELGLLEGVRAGVVARDLGLGDLGEEGLLLCRG